MIGVFDSGYGGLGVLRHLREALPEHDFVYFGDSGRAPYGGRDVHTILDFSEQAVELLFAEGCRLVIVACNTVSCVALRHLQQRYAPREGDRRVLGVTIPGAELAVAHSEGRIGIIATSRTVSSHTYETEIHKLSDHMVVQRAASLLAPIVEEGWEDSDIARLAVKEYLADFDVDTIVLGCTHYPMLLPIFHELTTARVLDPAPYLAERLVDWLGRHPGFSQPGSGRLSVLCSGDPDRFAQHGARFLGAPLPLVAHVAEVDGRLSLRDPGDAPKGQITR